MKFSKRYLLIIGAGLALAVSYQNCSKSEFSENSSKNKIGQKVSCSNNAFTDFVDQHPFNKGYSMLFIGGNDMDSNSYPMTFFAVPAPDTVLTQPIYRLSIYDVISPNSGILSAALSKNGIAVGAQALTYCQAKAICQDAFNSGVNWKSFSCDLGQYEFDSGGYVHIPGDGTNPGNHIKEYNRIIFFTVAGSFGNSQDTVSVTYSDGGVKSTQKVVEKATNEAFEKMKATGVLNFKY